MLQFVQFQFKYPGFSVSFLSRCQLSVLTKNEKNREIFHRFGGKRSFFVLFDERKEKFGLFLALFSVVVQRESFGTKNTLSGSLSRRKKELLIERTRNA